MDDFPQFPCQLGHSPNTQQESWASHAFGLELNKKVARNGTRHIETCLNLAFAQMIWEFTGDTPVRCLISTTQQRLTEHTTCRLAIDSTTTIEEALRDIAKSTQTISSANASAPSALVHITNDAELPAHKPLNDVPLQIVCATRDETSQLQFLVWFEKGSVHPFHVKKYGQRLATLIKSIWLAGDSDTLTQSTELKLDDEAFIRTSNSNPQEMDFRTIHECVSQTAAQDPHVIAIDAWDGFFSRQELESLSQRLACTLIDAGVQRGCIVSIMLDKSKWTAVSMLAVLKTGAAFLFLEPTLPFERLKIMIQKAACTHAIASRQHTSLACSLIRQAITIDGHGGFLKVDKGSGCQRNIKSQDLPKVSPQDVAFLIFTSGSSGIPKAIVTQHFAWVTGYTKHVQKFGIGEGTRVFQCASYSFVVSILDTISTLLAGGTVCIPSSDERINDLENAIRRLRPDYVCMTPSIAKIIDPANVPSIKTLVLVGEPIPRSLVEPWLANSNATIRNGYGQSEACSMNSTAILSESSSSYRTIGNSTWLRYWITDPWNHNRLMPVGGLGELVVEGYSVAQGYHEEPEKTSAAFIQSPAWAPRFGAGTDGRRWYKTGDLVQYQENGELFLYGRKDAQLKVHGQRVEAAEIEHQILKSFDGNISQVVVDKLAQGDDGEEEKLAAFVQLREIVNATVDAGVQTSHAEREQQVQKEMLKRLETTIPTWMIPATVILVNEMIRTATGKLDRRSLKEKYSKRVTTQDQGPLKTSSTEDMPGRLEGEQGSTCPTFSALRRIWSHVLNLNQDALTQDSRWAQVGGNSMNAMLLVRDAKAEGFNFTSADVLSGASLAELATKKLSSVVVSPAPSFKAEQLNERAMCDFSTPASDFQYHYVTKVQGRIRNQLHKYNIVFVANISIEQIQRAVHIWFCTTEAFRIKFHRLESGELVQSLTTTESPEWEQRLQAHDNDQQVVERSMNHDFVSHPVFASLQKTASPELGGIHLVLHVHHSIFDGLSFDLMLNDLIEACQGHILVARPSFLDYLSSRSTKHISESIDYWSETLHGSMPTTLRAKPETLISVDETLTNDTRTVSRVVYLQSPDERREVTMSTVVHCAWGMVLSAMSGKPDVIFLTLMHGRDEDVEGSGEIIGCCVTECPLRIQCTDAMYCSDFVKQVQRQVLSTTAHAHLGANTIASKCTEWPLKEKWYQHSSFVLHQNVVTKENMPVGDLVYVHVGYPDVEKVQMYDFDLLTKSADAGELSFELVCLEHIYSAEEADAVADAFTMAVRAIVRGEGTLRSLREKLSGIESLPRT